MDTRKQGFNAISIFVIGVLASTGCVTLAPQANVIQITKNPDDVAKCTVLGEVFAHPPYVMPNEDFKQMRNNAVLLHADTVLVLSRLVVSKGMAYKCH